MPNPKIIDDDKDTISAVYNDQQVRSWEYHSEDERRMKMRMAREWQEGFYHAAELFSEPEDDEEPEPLDPETVAQREESYRQQMIDAGRGHLLR